MNASGLAVRHIPREGPTSGPPVVLIHGFAVRGSVDWPVDSWDPALATLGREGFVVDLPGHGDSARSPARRTVTAMLEALGAVARAAAGPADVVAYSLGSRLAWDLTARSGARIRRLVLGGLAPVEPFGGVDLDAARALVRGDPDGADALTSLIVTLATAPGNDPAALLDVVAALQQEPFDPAASPPTVPTLLINGQDDPVAGDPRALARFVPDAEVQAVPGDHVGALHATQFRDSAVSFLDR